MTLTFWHCRRCNRTFTRWAAAEDHATTSGHGRQAFTLRSGPATPAPIQVGIW